MIANSLSERVPDSGTTERIERIVTASLAVFSEYSFRDATTEAIARRARVSKRDIYALFPNKRALLIAVIDMVLQEDDENIARVISLSRNSTSLQQRLEVIGLALIHEVLSLAMGFLSRLVPSESISQPEIGNMYFENQCGRRRKLISEVLSAHAHDATGSAADTNQAAEHFLALVIHLPFMSTLVGRNEMWHSNLALTHIENAIGCFLRAYPEYSG